MLRLMSRRVRRGRPIAADAVADDGLPQMSRCRGLRFADEDATWSEFACDGLTDAWIAADVGRGSDSLVS